MEKLEDIGKLTLQEIIGHISDNNFIMPMLQRDYVWDIDKVINLFDSLYRGYPTSNLILLEISSKVDSMEFYEMKKAISWEAFNNTKYNGAGIGSIKYCVMDGQQRITSIYHGFTGTLKRKRGEKFYDEYLCFNVLSDLTSDNIFESIKDGEIKSSGLWVKVKDILKSDDQIIDSLRKMLEKNICGSNGKLKRKGKTRNIAEDLIKELENNQDKIKKNLERIRNLYNKKCIVYETVTLEDLNAESSLNAETILDIFFRLNSGGKPLTPSDLLFSKITLYAKQKNEEETRKLFSDYLKELNKTGFRFTVDLFMRCLWLLWSGDKYSTFKSFLGSNKIKDYCEKEKFEAVKNALVQARTLYEKANYDSKNMTYNMILPIAYYCYYGGSVNEEAITEISKYFATATLTHFFSSHSDSTLVNFKKAMKKGNKEIGLFENNVFNFKLLKDKINQTATANNRFEVTSEHIKDLFKYRYDTDYNDVRKILFLLNKDWMKVNEAISYQEDHIHAKSMAQDVKIEEYKKLVGDQYSDEKYEFFASHYNDLANMQLLSPTYNISKLDESLKVWFLSKSKEEKDTVKNLYLIPYEKDEDLELHNFETFYKKRSNLMCRKLCKILEIEEFEIFENV